MTIYICPRCNYETDKRTNIKTHLNRKTSCKNRNDCVQNIGEILEFMVTKKNMEYICNGCKTVFTSIQSIRDHKKCCQCYKLYLQLELKDILLAKKDEFIAEKDKIIAEKDKIIADLKNQNTINSDDDNNVINYNIFLSDSREEDKSNIFDEFVANYCVKLYIKILGVIGNGLN